MRVPRPLKQGDVVRVIAPASPFRTEKLSAGIKILEAFGLRVVQGPDVDARQGYLAGDDTRRAAELRAAFKDPELAAVFPARGGYGCARTCLAAGSAADFLPSMLVGFSDITVLHVWLGAASGLVTFHGPNITTLPSLEPATLERYRRTLFGIDSARNFTWDGLATVRGGTASGPVLAANLTVLVSLAGTPFEPDLTGRILIIEDLNEKPYRLDRMLLQLSFMRGFEKAAAIVFGDFCLDGDDVDAFAKVVSWYSARWDLPVLTGFPCGHGAFNDCVPQHVRAMIDADRGRLFVDDPWA
ncbi:MAG TPA: LD-carboxypeptidase [Myxococcota bacterium]|nr:LD-carboxypeptidase [Myxococcota bacterium]